VAKRLAVLVRERQTEALRVAVGLTLNDDRVEVYVLDRPLGGDPENAAYVDTLRQLGVRVATNCADNAGLELVTNAQLARRLAACDAVVPY
jgi:hypothetical protein